MIKTNKPLSDPLSDSPFSDAPFSDDPFSDAPFQIHFQMLYCQMLHCLFNSLSFPPFYIVRWRERRGSVVECLTRDGEAAGSSLTGVTALCP